MMLIADLTNVDEVIRDEDKAVILLGYLLDDGYETFILTLINKKSSLSYAEVSTTLVNLDLRRKDKKSINGTLTEVLTVRGRSPNQREENRGRSKLSHELATVV